MAERLERLPEPLRKCLEELAQRGAALRLAREAQAGAGDHGPGRDEVCDGQ